MAKSKQRRSEPKGPVRAISAPSQTPPARESESRQQIVLQAATIFGLALLVRFVHFFLMRDSLLFQALVCDSGQYDVWAQRIASGQWLGTEVFYQTPLYPYLLAVTYTAFGHSVWAVRIVQALFGAAACVCLARAGSRYFSPRPGWISGVLLALYAPAIFFDGILQKASLDLLLMTALLWITAVLADRPRLSLFAVAGLVLGAMTLNRENAAVLFPVLIVWIGWLSWSSIPWSALRIGLPRAAALVLGAAVVLLPVGLRNYYVGGTFALTTSQMGTNFYIGNNPNANGGYETLRADRGDPRYEAEDARLLAEADLKRSLSPGEVSRYWMNRSWRFIKSDPSAWLRLMAWKWFLTWNAVEMVDAESIHTHQRHSPLLGVLGWGMHFGVLCPLAALGLWWTRHDWRRLWLLYLMLLAFAAAVTAFYVFARYRYPLVPLAALFAAAGIEGLWIRLRDGERNVRELAIGLGLAVAVAIGCNWPFAQVYNEDAITYYNAGTTLLDNNRFDDAETMLKQAAELDPSFSATFNNLGRAAQGRNQPAEAQRYFEQAVLTDPNHAVYHVNLASAQLGQKETVAAIASLQRAIQLDPLLTPAYSLLARAELEQGRSAEAIGHLRRVVQLQNTAAAHAELALGLRATGQDAAAVAELRAALALERSPPIGNTLAWILATSPVDAARNGAEAVELAESLCDATGNKVPAFLDTLAAAYAEVGQFDKATETCAKALALGGDAKQSEVIRGHQKSFEARQPLRDKVVLPTGAKSPAAK